MVTLYADFWYWYQLNYASTMQNLNQYPQAHLRKQSVHHQVPLPHFHFYGLTSGRF